MVCCGVYNELMEVYDSIAHGYSSFRVKAWDVVKELSASSGWVLDIGCGPCHNGLAYSLSHNSKLVCIDLSQEMLKIAKALVKKYGDEDMHYRVDVLQADMRYLPIRSGIIERVMYVATINHIHPEYLDTVFKEVLSTLKNGGEVLITIWALTHPTVLKKLIRNLLDLLLMRRKLKQLMDIYVPWRSKGKTYLRYYHIYTLPEITKKVKDLGLKVVKSGSYNPHKRLLPENYYLVLRK